MDYGNRYKLFLLFQNETYLPRCRMIHLYYSADSPLPLVQLFDPLPRGHPGVTLVIEEGPFVLSRTHIPSPDDYPELETVSLASEQLVDDDPNIYGRPLPLGQFNLITLYNNNRLLTSPETYPTIVVHFTGQGTTPRLFPLMYLSAPSAHAAHLFS